jgi:hypothetical protein
LCRAVDSAGETIEFMLSPKRDLVAAKFRLSYLASRAVYFPCTLAKAFLLARERLEAVASDLAFGAERLNAEEKRREAVAALASNERRLKLALDAGGMASSTGI